MHGFPQADGLTFAFLLAAHWACTLARFLETGIHRATACHAASFTADNLGGTTLPRAGFLAVAMIHMTLIATLRSLHFARFARFGINVRALLPFLHAAGFIDALPRFFHAFRRVLALLLAFDDARLHAVALQASLHAFLAGTLHLRMLDAHTLAAVPTELLAFHFRALGLAPFGGVRCVSQARLLANLAAILIPCAIILVAALEFAILSAGLEAILFVGLHVLRTPLLAHVHQSARFAVCVAHTNLLLTRRAASLTGHEQPSLDRLAPHFALLHTLLIATTVVMAIREASLTSLALFKARGSLRRT
jgi:hypothetical protein